MRYNKIFQKDKQLFFYRIIQYTNMQFIRRAPKDKLVPKLVFQIKLKQANGKLMAIFKWWLKVGRGNKLPYGTNHWPLNNNDLSWECFTFSFKTVLRLWSQQSIRRRNWHIIDFPESCHYWPRSFVQHTTNVYIYITVSAHIHLVLL